MGTTPLLIKNMNPGMHKITVKLEKYQTYVEDIEVQDNRIYNYKYFLTPLYASFFVLNDFWIKGEGDEKIVPPYSITDISGGYYKVRINKDQLEFSKSEFFTVSKWLTLGIGIIGSFVGFFGDALFPDLTTLPFFKGLFGGAGVISLTFSGIFFIMDWSTETKTSISIVQDLNMETDSSEYQRGLGLINSFKYDEALFVFSQFLEKYPNSKYTADVIYYIAFIYEMKDDYEKALKFYTYLVNQFPVIEWYDIALFSMSKIYYKQHYYEKSIQTLRNILFIDEDVVSREMVFLYLFRNSYYLYKTDKTYEKYLSVYFESFINQFPSSNYIWELIYKGFKINGQVF